MKMTKSSVRVLLPRFLLFAGLIAVAFSLTATPVSSATPDFSISISPSQRTLPHGGGITSFTVTITALNGFNGTVSPSGGAGFGCPNSFQPNTITGSGTSQDIIDCLPSAASGERLVAAVGTSGTLQHRTFAELTIQ